MNTLWLAEMPDCFGYGLMVLGASEDEARRKLKTAYKDWAKSYQLDKSFDDALDYFGGTIREVTIGEVYNDGFRR